MEINGYSFERPSWYGLDTEARGLLRCFIPHRDNNTLTKLITLVFVAGWVVITVAMALEDIASVRPVFYGFYTAIVFLVLGRIWGLEIDNIIGNNP